MVDAAEHERTLSTWELKQLPLMIPVKNRTSGLLQGKYPKVARRMEKCGTPVGPYRPIQVTCGSSSWCPLCISYRAKRQRDWISKIVLRQAPGSLTWVHVTSTVQPCLPADLRISIQTVITGTARLLKRFPLVVGSISATESTPWLDRPEYYNPHAHSLVAFRIDQGQSFPSSEEWTDMWQDVCPNNLARSIVADVLLTNKDRQNVANYLTKDAEYAKCFDHRESFICRWNERLDNPERFILEVEAGLNKKRFFGNLIRPKTAALREAWAAPWERFAGTTGARLARGRVYKERQPAL